MTFKTQINELSVKIKDLEDKSASLQADSFVLRQKREGLIAKMIIEDQLMTNTEWELTFDHSTSVRLTLKKDPDNRMEYVSELARTDYHSWFEIMDGVNLQFDDSEISLTFKEAKLVVSFAKKNGMKISGAAITAKLAQLKRDASALEVVCHQFNLINK